VKSLYLDCRQFLIVIKSPQQQILKSIANAFCNFFFTIKERRCGKEIRAVIVVEPSGGSAKDPVTLIFNQQISAEAPNLEFAILQISYFISQVCIYELTGLVKIHGAAFANGNKVLAVSANKYAGKSSLTVALGSENIPALTDELVLLDPQNQKIWPFPRPIALSDRAYRNISDVPLRRSVFRQKPRIYAFNGTLQKRPYRLARVVLLTRSRSRKMEFREISREAGTRRICLNLFDVTSELTLDGVDFYHLHASDLADMVRVVRRLIYGMGK
jgi:hypothetical protein